jgi:hypothetical protein
MPSPAPVYFQHLLIAGRVAKCRVWPPANLQMDGLWLPGEVVVQAELWFFCQKRFAVFSSLRNLKASLCLAAYVGLAPIPDTPQLGTSAQSPTSGFVYPNRNRVSRHARSCHVFSNKQENIMLHFRIRGLPAEHFAALFALSDDALRQHGAVRQIADREGYPCRISLTDAAPGDELILVNYEHHAVDSPYRMRFAIYVRKGEATFDQIDTVPEQLRTRTLAVRGFDGDGMMTGRELVEGVSLEDAIEHQFADPRAAYLHIHFAAAGCYAARVERA